MMPTDILLCTINARYNHASLGLRYLRANLGALRDRSQMMEFTLQKSSSDMLEAILAASPKIVGFGIYIWNTRETLSLIQHLKLVRPDITVIIGGPEVSHEWEEQAVFALCDYLITGAADQAFAFLCQQLLNGTPPKEKVLQASLPSLADIEFPHNEFSDTDLAQRYLYVEASRGCPFKCEFCLSSLDKTAWPFSGDRVLKMLDELYQRGARHFKFVDRTFNLKIDACKALLQFFLDRMDEDLFLHFELIPDRLPSALKEMLVKFPPGSMQFEIGVQSFNPDVQQLISRKQNDQATCDNIAWLRQNTHIHLHTDLIAGLPKETLESFAQGFNKLDTLGSQEIQLGILKRLRGTPLVRHTETFDLRFSPEPPYEVLTTSTMSFADLQGLKRFAKYWDLIANSGRFNHTLPILKGSDTFGRFWWLSGALHQYLQASHGIALPRLVEAIEYVCRGQQDHDQVVDALRQDCLHSGMKKMPTALGGERIRQQPHDSNQKHNKRQRRHLTKTTQ